MMSPFEHSILSNEDDEALTPFVLSELDRPGETSPFVSNEAYDSEAYDDEASDAEAYVSDDGEANDDRESDEAEAYETDAQEAEDAYETDEAYETEDVYEADAYETDESETDEGAYETPFEGEIDSVALGIPAGMATAEYTGALQEADVVSEHVHVRWGLHVNAAGKGAFLRDKLVDANGSSLVKRVVIHVLQSRFASSVTNWHRLVRDSSAHYVVSKKGAIAQLIAERHLAAHANTANRDSIGVEHDGEVEKTATFTHEMYFASARLVEDICARHAIPIDRRHVIGHAEVYDGCHGDPGGYFDWDFYMALLRDRRAIRERRARPALNRMIRTMTATTPWKVRKPSARETRSEALNAWKATHIASAAKNPVATFEFLATDTGFHDVSLWFAPWSTNTKTALVRAFVGATTTPSFEKTIDQTARSTRRTCALPATPKWRPVGAVRVTAGDKVRVEITSAPGATGNVVADAARLMITDRVDATGLKVDEPSRLPCFARLNDLCAWRTCRGLKAGAKKDACIAKTSYTAAAYSALNATASSEADGLSYDDEIEAHEAEDVSYETDEESYEAESDEASYESEEAEEEVDSEAEGYCCSACAAQEHESDPELEEEKPKVARKQRFNTSAELLARWNLKTNVSGAATFHDLIDLHKPAALAKVPTALLVSFSAHEAGGFGDATHGKAGNKFTSPPFYEIGLFQVPAGIHGKCTSKLHSSCASGPPGVEPTDKKKWSSWKRHAVTLELDPARWDDPETQTRIGLAYVAEQLAVVKNKIVRVTSQATFDSLFPTVGSAWYLQALVLMPHAGVGTASAFLLKHRTVLIALPEDARWTYLSRVASTSEERRAVDNVEPKMAGYYELLAILAGGSSGATRATGE